MTKRVGVNSKDEIGDMAAAVNRFVDKLQPIVREAGDVAQRTGVEIGVMTLWPRLALLTAISSLLLVYAFSLYYLPGLGLMVSCGLSEDKVRAAASGMS